MISLLEQYNKASDTWSMTTDLGNAFFSIPIRKKDQKQFEFTWDGQQYLFIVLPKTMLTLHLLSECSLERLLDCLDILHDITLISYIIVMSVSPMLCLWFTPMTVWEIP